MNTTTETRLIPKFNPATGGLLHEFEAVDASAVCGAVDKARKAFETYRHTSLKTRARLLKTIAALLYRKADEIATLISTETGKPLVDAMESDLAVTLNLANYYAGIGPKRLKPRHIASDFTSIVMGRTHLETFHPRGVIGIISPWNYPLAIPASGVLAALMTGNTVILKPSELTPGTGEALIAIVREALASQDLPPDVVQVLPGDGRTGSALLDAAIDGVIFTGSANTGKHVRERISGRGLWSSLELGGSDAMIILPGCDLEKAASYAVWGRFANAGQACASAKRLFVAKKDEAKLLSLLADKIAKVRVGPPFAQLPDAPGVHVGPLISAPQRALVEAQVQDAVTRGARLIAGGQRLSPEGHEKGYYFAPALLADVPADARLLQEEVFGPALPVIPYESVDEAIAKANDSPYGLTASVFGPPDAARAIATRLHCATVVIHDIGTSNYAMVCAPWSGWKDSGAGASHGERSLTDLCRVQIVTQNWLFNAPFFGKPFWQFGNESHAASGVLARARTILKLAARRPEAFSPATLLTFWQHRTSSKL